MKSLNAPNNAALVVDLDGTLIRGDTLWESFFALARANPLAWLAACFALLRGRAAFKQAVAARASLSLKDVALNGDVMSFVTSEAETRPLVLATAADGRIARRISEELGIFREVIASDGRNNLKGANKLRAIETWLANEGVEAFDYIGDSVADRPIWAKANNVYVVAATDEAAARIAGGDAVKDRFEKPRTRPQDFIRAMRPHQWVKNILIFLPLLLSQQFFSAEKIIAAVAAFAAFSLCASATYIWNDILDIRADRAHPRKKNRPFASGVVSIPAGMAFSFALIAVSALIAVAALPIAALFLLAGYIVITLTYSLYFKEKLLVDAMTLGLLYAYRIIIGAAAASIIVSDWLIAFSMFFFFGLALVKRYTEVASKPADMTGKIAGRGYYAGDREVIGGLGVASSFVSVLIMALYIKSPEVSALYSNAQMLWIVCLVMIYWLGRIWVLAHRDHMPDDPIVFALRDKNSIFAGLICLCAVLLAI